MGDDTTLVKRLQSAGCVFAEEEAKLFAEAARDASELEGMVRRRVEGLPLEQVVGWAEFAGLRILVEPGVFVPRRRSEFLAATAIELATASGPGTAERPVVVDVCCGTGALGLAVTAGLKDAGHGEPGRTETGRAEADRRAGSQREDTAHGEAWCSEPELHAAEVDPDAVACARRNVEPRGGRVYEGDLFAPLPETLKGRVTTLLCNAPYVPTGDIAFLPAEAREYEHRVALDGGDDGLRILRRAAAEAPAWLAPGGYLLVETSERQSETMAAIMTESGLKPRIFRDEEYGSAVVTGTLVL